MVTFIKNDILQVWDTGANESKWVYYILSF